MLTQLSIRNFAIIASVDLEFHQGVTVFTGETGAGKSILMDALAMVLGARASTEHIRNGADALLVTAMFDITDRVDVRTFLQTQNISEDASETDLIVSRRLDVSGKGRILVNGAVTPLRTLAALGELLVDIHAQDDHRRLCSPAYQLSMLDTATPQLIDSVVQYRHAYQNWQKQEADYRTWRSKVQELQEKKELLATQIAEIDAAQLTSPEEDDELATAISRATHAEKIVIHMERALTLLTGHEQVQEKLAHAVRELERASEFDDTIASFAHTAEASLISIEEAIRDLQEYVYTIQFSPAELNRLQTRAQEIRQLKRKYGGTLTEILTFAEHARKELDAIATIDEEGTGRQEALARAESEAQLRRDALNALREKEATGLCRQLTDVLQELDLAQARLHFQFDFGTELTPSGLDRAELYFAPNPGEEAKPLKDIASGGEMSRLALAVKAIDRQQSVPSTWVLDEVDVGISGNAAIRVGKLIHRIGQSAQVLCITHLAQTAAAADHHVHLFKKVEEGRTSTYAHALNETEHIQEIARMLEGDSYSSKAQETATRLIAQIK